MNENIEQLVAIANDESLPREEREAAKARLREIAKASGVRTPRESRLRRSGEVR